MEDQPWLDAINAIVNNAMIGVNQRLDAVDERLVSLELNQKRLLQAVTEIDQRLKSVETDVRGIRSRTDKTFGTGLGVGRIRDYRVPFSGAKLKRETKVTLDFVL